MYRIRYITISFILLVSCKETTNQDSELVAANDSTNCITFDQESLDGFEWMNDPRGSMIQESGLRVDAFEGSDFFNNPEDLSVTATAPFLYQTQSGDFIAKALVKPDFNAQWNAISLMAYIDEYNWIKFAFESSDATGPSVVTVVTKGVSDDANGVVIDDSDSLWLALVKKDSIYAMHWSKDGKEYKMARLTTLPNAAEVKIGVEFQSPVGDRAKHKLKCYEFQKMRVENLRDINQ